LKRHYRPDQKSRFLLNITPETAQWKYISFKVARLSPNETIEANTATEEVVIVPLVGRGKLLFNGQTYELARKDLFRELADIVYLPEIPLPYFATGAVAGELAGGVPDLDRSCGDWGCDGESAGGCPG
jgi:5-deoxy-glucuronate isomerase